MPHVKYAMNNGVVTSIDLYPDTHVRVLEPWISNFDGVQIMFIADDAPLITLTLEDSFAKAMIDLLAEYYDLSVISKDEEKDDQCPSNA